MMLVILSSHFLKHRAIILFAAITPSGSVRPATGGELKADSEDQERAVAVYFYGIGSQTDRHSTRLIPNNAFTVTRVLPSS